MTEPNLNDVTAEDLLETCQQAKDLTFSILEILEGEMLPKELAENCKIDRRVYVSEHEDELGPFYMRLQQPTSKEVFRRRLSTVHGLLNNLRTLLLGE
jgi:hypothetical protein